MVHEWSRPRAAPRSLLLDQAIDYVTAHGWRARNLRRLAEALGTSHRMLIYHFGSKDGLLVAIVDEVEARQRAALAELQVEAAAAGDHWPT